MNIIYNQSIRLWWSTITLQNALCQWRNYRPLRPRNAGGAHEGWGPEVAANKKIYLHACTHKSLASLWTLTTLLLIYLFNLHIYLHQCIRVKSTGATYNLHVWWRYYSCLRIRVITVALIINWAYLVFRSPVGVCTIRPYYNQSHQHEVSQLLSGLTVWHLTTML